MIQCLSDYSLSLSSAFPRSDMGVQGLTTLLYSRSERAQPVDLVAEAVKRRQTLLSHSCATTAPDVAAFSPVCSAVDRTQTHTSLLLESFARHPTSLFVLVDGLGVFHELTHIDVIAARTLPAYDVLHARVTAMVQSLRSVGIELIVYFDTSSTETTKREEILRRAEGRVSPHTEPTSSSSATIPYRVGIADSGRLPASLICAACV